MIRFECDYLEGAHEKVLQMLQETNMEQTPGYGMDPYCEKARELVKKHCKDDNVDVHLLVGGTQTNKTIIAATLRPYQGALCASTGHINVHETGAIEATGHKVLPLDSTDGKITAKQIQDAYDAHWNDGSHEHTVQPGMVYISNPTENGTLYTKKELTEISETCHKCNLPLMLDGARLGYGIMAKGNDLTVADIARLCDVFYIGGTKVGALFGEAVVITNENLKKDFRYFIKQNGGMLAKGRLLGIQFIALLEDDLYFQISDWADKQAYRIKDALTQKGIGMLFDSMTNQQYPIFETKQLETLNKKYSFDFWTKIDENHSAVRICTSWATKKENVDSLIEDIKNL